MGHADTHRRLHELVNARDYDGIAAQTAPGFHYEDLPRALVMKTTDEFIDWIRAWITAMSDARSDAGTYFEGADFSVSLFHGRGVNDGEMPPFQATGRMADVPMCEVLHYASDGKVLSGEIYYDSMTLLAQLGHVTPPGTDEAMAPDLAAVVRELFARFNALDIDGVRPLLTSDVQGVDEISRRWMRGIDTLDEYFTLVSSSISDIHSELSDIRESVSGETGLVTCWLEQDYNYNGEAQHVSAPTTIQLRREAGAWKVCLVHSVSLPPEPAPA